MVVVRSVLVVLAALCSTACAEQTVPEWNLVGMGRVATYEVLNGSVIADDSAFTKEFIMRVTPHKARELEGKKVKILIQRALAMCVQNTLVIMDEERLTESGELVNVFHEASTYPNQMIPGDPVSEIMQQMCGIKTREKPQRKKVEV